MKPPTLSLANMPKVINVKAGQPLICEIPYTGTDPIIHWNKDGGKLDPRHKTKTGIRTILFNQVV